MSNIYINAIQAKIEQSLNSKKFCQYALMFHSISPKEMWYDKNFCITPESFENMLLEMGKKEVHFNSIDNLSLNGEGRTVYITFDDIFADVFIYAYPILKKYNIPFTIFVTVDFIGKANMIDRKMLRVLAKDDLCTIGVHTLSHKNLSKCTKNELMKEIYGAKCTLEFLLKKNIDYMAYPYGNIVHVPLTAVIIAILSKYKGAFSTISAPLHKYMKYIMPRINVNESNWRHVVNKCCK